MRAVEFKSKPHDNVVDLPPTYATGMVAEWGFSH